MTEAITQAIVSLIKKHEKSVILSGKAVNVSDDTFDLQMEGKPDIFGVRIGAIAGGYDNYMKIIPAENSFVLVGIIENSNTEAVLIATSEIEKIISVVNGAEFHIQDGKFVVKNGQADCKEILTGLLSQLQNAIIQTPAGPGNFSPADIDKFNEITQKVNQLFE